jgi:hypothetical protein
MVHGNAAEILSLPRQAFDNMTFIVIPPITRPFFFAIGFVWNYNID